MRYLLVALIAILITTASLANTISRSGRTIITDGQVRTATRGEWVHANIPRIPRYKILRSNPHKVTHRILDGKFDDYLDDDSLINPYRRRDLSKIEHPNDVSDDVSWKLFLIRQLALAKYREKFG